MSRWTDADAARVRLALVVLMSGAIALLMPTLTASHAEAPSAVMLSAVAALVVAVVGRDRHLSAVVTSPLAAPAGSTDEGPPFLAGRVTDTSHHPLRPRAPGPV